EIAPYFYLEKIAGIQPSGVSDVRNNIPSIAVVHALTPVEHQEKVLSDDYIRKNLGSRLSSRHFRNQLRVWREQDCQDFEELLRYQVENTPGVDSVDLSLSSDQMDVDLFLRESG